jgi:hypothetical protein
MQRMLDDIAQSKDTNTAFVTFASANKLDVPLPFTANVLQVCDMKARLVRVAQHAHCTSARVRSRDPGPCPPLRPRVCSSLLHSMLVWCPLSASTMIVTRAAR